MSNLDGCQIPCLPKISEGMIRFDDQPLKMRIKRLLAKPWNYYVKKYLKRLHRLSSSRHTKSKQPLIVQPAADTGTTRSKLLAGDWVSVRTIEEIQTTLDNWKELKGCAFLENMGQYCGTSQRVLVSMERFLDERDYKVKKCKGIILLEGVMCEGTPVFGKCDRRCHFFWREEWLEKIPNPEVPL